tara:strand:- start:33912 stop:39212 length:5301 start_codon:yes stop_codon:yes gene_type:complete
MKHSFSKLIAFAFLFFATVNLQAQTTISGTISGDSTVVWDLAGSPYVISGSTTISTFDTVMIESGVEVKFDDNIQLTVSGALIADGVTFTSNTGTSRESWNRIYGNNADTYISLKNSSISFATHAIEMASGALEIDTVNISDSKYGLYLTSASNTTINESIITGNNYPIYLSSEAAVTYSGNTDLTGNDVDAIWTGFTVIDQNWVLNDPGVPYFFPNSNYVTYGDTLTVSSGVIVKMGISRELRIDDGGVLIAVADPGEEIFFTSMKNDNMGGDTNDDGTATAPGNRDWYGIRILGSTSKSLLKRVNVSFAGYIYTYSNDYRGGLTFIDNESVVDSSVFNNNYYGIVARDSSDAVITNNTIGSSGVVPVALTFDSNPVFTDNSFSSSNNEYDAIGLIGTTIQGSNILPKRDFTSIPNVTYLLLSELYVDTGAFLEIQEGVVIKSNGPGIRVKGTVTAIGTGSEYIVFTSVKDDNVGNPNDTNKDGNNTVPDNNDWRGLAFGEDAGGSVLDYNKIRYATYNTSFYYDTGNNYIYPKGAVNLMNSDVSISNSEIANTTNYAIDSRGVSMPTITNNDFSNTGSVPVAMDLSSDPTFSGNTLTNVGLIALGYHGGVLNNNGIIRNRTFGGYVDITNILLENATVASGTSLTIEPGSVLKMVDTYDGAVLSVAGSLIADGSESETIYVTSIKDDNVGNPTDTNGDGATTSPDGDDWGAIRFLPTSDDVTSIVDNIHVRYGKHGIIFTDAAPTVDSVTVLSCRYLGFVAESGSTVHIENSTIQNCGWDPIAISTTSNPTFSNITFNSNGSNGVSLLESNNFSTYYYGFNAGDLYFDTRNVMSTNTTITPYSIAGYTDMPFIMHYQFFVGENTTVSVAPKVILKGNHTLYVDGALRVLGTVADPVIFTSEKDDSAGGDSNNDGNDSAPNRGESLRMYFRASSIDSSNLVKNAQFRYSSNAIYFENADAKIDSSLFQLTSDHAIRIYGNSAPDISNNRFENIGQATSSYRRHSVYMDMFTDPTFSNNIESNVSLKGLGINYGNWGSDATIPYRSFAGVDTVTYVLHGNIDIPSGTKIIIPEGIVFKKYTAYGTYRSGSFGLRVDGALKVQGTASNPVIFTGDVDDGFGKPVDLYTDGQVNDTYRSGTWIQYSETSEDTANIVDHAIFKHASRGVVANSANPTIRNSHFENIEFGIEMTGVSEPFVENNSFYNLNKTPLLISLVSYPQSIFGNSMSGSTYKAIGVRTETLVQDVTLPKRDFAGKIGIPYYYTGNYTIGTGAVLTIAPGVVNKFENYAGLFVEKGLNVEGGSTPDSMVVFTSIRDDFYSGDTNADSNATTSGTWYGITYRGTSLPAESNIDYAIIKNVRGGTSYAAVLADNSSPTITNSILTENGSGLVVYGSGNPTVNYSDIYNNSDYGVYNRDKTFTIDATNNWWGNDSGPTHSTNPTGTGDEITDNVNYAPFVGGGASIPILGDVSLNGSVQSFDAAKVLRNVAMLEAFTPTQDIVADVSGNGSVSAMDASYILQYVVGLIEAFPEELNSKARDEMNTYPGLEDIALKVGAVDEVSDVEFKVPLRFDNVSELFAFELAVDFDNSVAELVDVEYSEVLKDASTIRNVEDGKLTLAMASTTSIEQGGDLVVLTFRLTDPGAYSTLSISNFIANEVNMTTTAVNTNEISLNAPTEFKLHQNYPNPFNPSTTIGFEVPDNNTMVRLEIYNILGQRVKTLVNDVHSIGRYSVRWDGTNDAGMQVSTGIYLYRIQAGDIVQSKKLTFIK